MTETCDEIFSFLEERKVTKFDLCMKRFLFYDEF